VTEQTAEFTTEDKTKIWDAFWQTDPSKTKSFSRVGGFKGTATSPTYIKERLTAFFGPVGLGWGYKVIDEELIKGHKDKEGINQVVIHKVLIEFWYIFGKRRSEPIQAFGQTTMVGKYSTGWFTDEEAPKKSLTDALTKAVSDLGMSADIHAGLYEDCKYVAELKKQFNVQNSDDPQTENSIPSTEETIPTESKTDGKKVTKSQAGLIYHKFEESGFSKDDMKNFCMARYGVESNFSLPMVAVKEILQQFDDGELVPGATKKNDDDIPF